MQAINRAAGDLGIPFFSHTFFPVFIAVLVWGGLLLRDERARDLSSARTHTAALS